MNKRKHVQVGPVRQRKLGAIAQAKRKRFVANLLADPQRNVAAAYIAAGFSPNGAKQSAFRIMKEPEIAEQLAIKETAVIAKLDIKITEGLEELRAMMKDWTKTGLTPAHVKACELFCIINKELPTARGMIEGAKRNPDNSIEVYRAAWMQPSAGEPN